MEGGTIAFVKDWGAFLHVKDNMIVCSLKGKDMWSVSPVELSSIVFLVTGSVSSEVIALANEYGIDLVFFKKGEPIAKLIPARYGGSMKVWLSQLKAWKSSRVKYASVFVKGKLRNQRVVLRYYERKYSIDLSTERLQRLEEEVITCSTVKQVMGKEAEGARIYWSSVKSLIPLKFPGRKRKSEDPFNVALNVGYAMLRRRVWSAVISAGLNPYVGFLHSIRSGRESLVFDLMEEFRPLVDKFLIGKAREKGEEGISLREVYRGLSNVGEDEVFTQARRLARSFEGEEYSPFLMK
jgi:CRISPR-associated protein Cas1